ncbi:MAG: DciA family protein [Rhodovarius sp.]|nr:DciA family protein [Rhodovarius sp.]
MSGSYREEEREGHGPRPLAALTASLVRPVLRRLAPGSAQLLAEWEALVGPELAARTTPRRLERGTLTIACSGPTALELTMLGPALIERINAGLGRPAVKRLRFVQAVVHPPHPASPARPTPPERLPEAVARRLAAIPAGPLRDALENLARGVYRESGGQG